MEVTEPEVSIPNNELVSLESSLNPSENYSISDFTVADTSAFDLDLSTQPGFADTYYLLDPITEESYEDSNPEETLSPIEAVKDKEIISKMEIPVGEKVGEISDKEDEIRTRTEIPVDERVEEICVEVRVEQVKTFDLSKIANLVYSQEPIDGDPARPSPVHRTLDVGDDSGDDSCYFENVAIEEVVLSEGASYLKERNEFEGLSKVREVFVKEEVSVVENQFDFTVS